MNRAPGGESRQNARVENKDVWLLQAIDLPRPTARIEEIRTGGAMPTSEELGRFGFRWSDATPDSWIDRFSTPISWANKPFEVVGPVRSRSAD
jgi:hypothetical protein